MPYYYYWIPFLDVACPTLEKTTHVLVLHGEGDGTLDHMKVFLCSTNANFYYTLKVQFGDMDSNISNFDCCLEKEAGKLDST